MRKNFKDVGFYPQPVLIIGTYDADGVPDAMNVGWGGLVGGGYVEINISQGHKTTENLSLKGAFTVSFADRAHLTEADYVGLVSGHTTPDKIARAGLTPVRSAFVDAPLFEEFPLTLECQVVERSDGPGGVRIVGQVVNMSADEAILGEDGPGPVRLRRRHHGPCSRGEPGGRNRRDSPCGGSHQRGHQRHPRRGGRCAHRRNGVCLCPL